MSVDTQFVRTRANLIRHNFIEEMEKHLLAFETAVVSHQIKVQWVVDENNLIESLYSLLPKTHYNRICFDCKNVPELVNNSSSLIQRVSVEDFEKDSADILFVHADYGIVENGSIVFMDRKTSSSFNKVSNLVILLDIDKLLIKQNDLETIVTLKYGNNTPRDIKILNYPFQLVTTEPFMVNDGDNVKKENVNITLFLYDNGVSTILENNLLRESLYCIECGKCSTVCPVFKHTGKFSPIDLIKYNCFEDNLKGQTIFGNTTVCGNCNEVCPVYIPLTDLIITEMEICNSMSSREKTIDYMKIFSKRSRLNKMNNKLRRLFFIRKYFGKNKKLAAYFRSQTDPFYNISQSTQTKV